MQVFDSMSGGVMSKAAGPVRNRPEANEAPPESPRASKSSANSVAVKASKSSANSTAVKAASKSSANLAVKASQSSANAAAVPSISAVARKGTSKFEPNPEVRAASRQQAERQAAPEVQPESLRYLEIGAGYKMKHKHGSAHSTVVRVLAKEGKFEEAVKILSDEAFDPANRDMAVDLLSKIFVRKESLEKMVRQDPIWKNHAARRIENLKKRAANGDAKAAAAAKKTLENAARVQEGQWVGNVKEIISTCTGSYVDFKEAEQGLPESQDAKKRKRNVRKFRDAGLIFRQYPLKPVGEEEVFIMLYPSRYNDVVKKSISTAFGVVEK